MKIKFRTLVTKKKPQRRIVKFFSFVRKPGPVSYRPPLAITIGTGGLTQEQIDLLKELEAKGLIPKITWITSTPNGFDDLMKLALLYLHSDEAKEMGCKMVKGYDYAWIKIALDRGPIPDRYYDHRYMSMPKFVDYIKSLGFKDIAGSKTLNKARALAKWHSEGNMLTFPNSFVDNKERNRRNNIVVKFLEIIKEV